MRELLGACAQAMDVKSIAQADVVRFESWCNTHGLKQEGLTWNNEENLKEYAENYFEEVSLLSKDNAWYIQLHDDYSAHFMLWASWYYTKDDSYPTKLERLAQKFVAENADKLVSEEFINKKERGRN